MASYLRPRRGKKDTAISQNIVLKRGEIFMEVPNTGVGTGLGKIKIGDGTTSYSNLPYFIDTSGSVVDVATELINYSESSSDDAALTDIASGKPLKTILGGLKKLVTSTKTTAEALANSTQVHWLSNTYMADQKALSWTSATYPFIKATSVFKVYTSQFGIMPEEMGTTYDAMNNVIFSVKFTEKTAFPVLVSIQNPTTENK